MVATAVFSADFQSHRVVDQLPLLPTPTPTRTRERLSTPPWRRSYKALVFALLVASVGTCLFVFRTAQLLSDAKIETNHVGANMLAASSTSSTAQPNATYKVQVFNPQTDGSLSEYTCVSWRQTGKCSPDGPREPQLDRACDVRIHAGASGFCEIQHKATGARRRVLPTHCTSLYHKKTLECNTFADLLQYGSKTTKYTHDRGFSFTKNQHQLLRLNGLDSAPAPTFFHRGIVMVVYEALLLGAYVSIRSLREELGSTLPVEMWYRRAETSPTHPLLQLLVQNYSVYLREFDDPLATGFYTKLYAVFYSAFDNVLLLDADNYAVKDPTYLFDTDAFKTNGAIFWPDFWQPRHTLFNVHSKSLVWQVFDLPYVDMFEQESGQVLINRNRHFAALNALMYYGFTLPRLHEEMRLVWGDKDLFRFAWMKTNSSFFMVQRPPGSAGRLNNATNKFCGLTMVQHDPHDEIVFLHRNMQKLRDDNRVRIWTHIQQFRLGAPTSEYRIGWAKVFDQFPSCWAKATRWHELYTFTPIVELYGELESTLLQFADQGVATLNGAMAPTPTTAGLPLQEAPGLNKTSTQDLPIPTRNGSNNAD